MNEPIALIPWIAQNRQSLQPPVGNQLLWPSRDYIIMVVAGPNQRQDYHINQGEEFFYQIEGDLVLKVIEQGEFKDILIRQGETFLLPGGVPHSPQRAANTTGLVIEQMRAPESQDAFQWYCLQCQHKMYEVTEYIDDIVKALPKIFEQFYGNPKHCTCRHCGWQARPADADDSHHFVR